jgi:hypothetical protein
MNETKNTYSKKEEKGRKKKSRVKSVISPNSKVLSSFLQQVPCLSASGLVWFYKVMLDGKDKRRISVDP